MKCLVTGGAGFIGSNVVAAALRRYEVVVLDNLASGFRENLRSTSATFIEGDILDRDALRKAVRGCDVVFHLAASVGNKRAIDNPLEDSKVNVLGTLQVLEACREAKVRKIVASSSAGIFGELKRLPIREDHPVEPDTPYGASKLAAEKHCLAYAKLHDIEAVCLRYFNVYGPNQRFDAYGNVIPIFAFKMLAGEPITVFGDGEQTRDFVSVHDVVQANLKAAENVGISGAFNIGSGARITINALVELLGAAVGKPAQVRYGPPRAGDVRHSLADISASAAAFGYKPVVDIASGLKEYINWARTEKVPA